MVRIRVYDPDKEPHPLTHDAAPSSPVESSVGVDAVPPVNWVSQLGWKRNPFTDFPARPASQYLAGHDDARRVLSQFFAEGNRVATLTGPLGIGKTLFLAWLAEELGKRPKDYRVVIATPTMGAKAFTDLLVKPYKGMFSSYSGETNGELAEYLAKKEKRRIALMIDDADDLGDLEPVLRAFLSTPSISILLAGERIHPLQSDALAVNLKPLTLAQAQLLLETRIRGVGGSGFAPLSARSIAELWKAAEADPIRFLRYSEETAMRLATGQLDLADENADDDAKSAGKKGTKKGVKNVPSAKAASGKKASKAADEPAPAPAAPATKGARRTEFDTLISELVEKPKK